MAKSARRSAAGPQRETGLPKDWRHEALSVRLALMNPKLAEASDPALVLWLVGTHHGSGRPLFPHADELDEQDRDLPAVSGLVEGHLPGCCGPQRLGFAIDGEVFAPGNAAESAQQQDLRGVDWPQLFVVLKARYGVWGLAHLEAVMRLADHRGSEHAEQRALAKERNREA